MATRIRAHDWAGGPLGPIKGWPQSLRTAVEIIVGSGHAMQLAWGAERIVLYNDAYAPMLGERHPVALGRPFRDAWPDVWEEIVPLVDKVFAGETVRFEDMPLVMTRHGYPEETWWNFSYSPVRDEMGAVAGLLNVTVDATPKIRAEHAEAALRDSEARLRDLADTLEQKVAARTAERDRMWDTSPDLMVEASLEGVYQRANPAWRSVLGYEPADVVGSTAADFTHPDDMKLMFGALATVQTDRLPSVNLRFRHRDGSYCWIQWVAAPSAGLIFAIGRDVTVAVDAAKHLRETEEALRQSQKMEAVGQLTGGLAHDFNNLLAGISGSLELMQTRLQQGRFNDVERYMAAAQGASKRAAALTHRLLAFSRRQTLDPRPTDANRLAVDMQEMIQRTVGPAITIEVVGASGVWPALVDPSQLENALLNLCINARDAMPDGGRITVETANKWLDERAARQQGMPEGQYLVLSVTDTGTGMPPEVIEHVFEPFFTTKPLGEGTGLGLSMIYGFAQQSGGQVRIYSEVGNGTTVSIYLPRYYGAVPDESEDALANPLPRSEQGETVLVVDDEPTVRMLVTDVLEDLGYTAIEAGDSVAGLKLLQSDTRIDLLVTDVGLPGGMNGRQMADAARVTRPNLKVLFITGYAENSAVGNGHLAPGMAVMSKPFAVDMLAARIRSLIEASRGMSTIRHSGQPTLDRP
ncbi:PAS domain-containing protein [Methylobacterium sp. C25]|uniref:hybrid sensor histidine kinase/response regulator n=1 Tax=Methylobacterium sp. C25 TaxID=2721622 RepID=UPI001F1F5A71|nr:PAS domain-containing sensor histidine kinase [Methylobacterium sp. C25]MCE4226185.1 PAS domain-containing protein [Methylobacterium sp. C25]